MMDPGNDDAMLTTPELSYLIRQLKASGGINLSASHNPPDDNGVKVYDENGGQYLPPHDQALTDRSREITEVRRMPFSEAVAAGLVRDIPPTLLDSYMALYLDRARARGLASQDRTKVVFTPLNGCGLRTIGHALVELGYEVKVPDGQGPDGTFKNIPLNAPNPEVKEATEPAKAVADAVGARLVLASDPDADRMGAEVFHDGQWVHVSGNEIAIILAYFLMLDPQGPRLKGGVYQSIVTTLATQAIAERAGVPAEAIRTDLLIGFKYIGKAVREYAEKLGPGADDTTLLAFACEESHGYLDTPQLRDKDAMGGGLYLARLHERLAAEGRTLLDYVEQVYAEIGDFGDRGRSITIPGSGGIAEIKRTMEVLRATRPMDLGGVTVTEYVDHWDTARFGDIKGATDREARNIVVFFFDGGRITFRPSGTEPKLKFYVATSTAGNAGSAQEYADKLSDLVYQHVIGILGRALSAPFVSLPDVIPLSNKVDVQEIVEQGLRQTIAEPGQSPEFVADWLREKLGAKIPGESAWEIALPAIRATVAGWSPDETGKVEAVLATRRA
jgi:phosphoglucomutase